MSWSARTDAAYQVLGSEAQACTAENEMKNTLDQLEKSYFEHGLFQAWMILLFLSVYGVSAWATLTVGLPI